MFTRLVVNLREPQAEALEALTRGGRTRTEVVQRAIARDKFIEDERAAGSRFSLTRTDGSTVELVWP